MDSQSIDELVTLRARVAELEASIAAHFAKVHGPESITACEAVTRLEEYAAKLKEADDEWNALNARLNVALLSADELRVKNEKQAEALRAARELADSVRNCIGYLHDGSYYNVSGDTEDAKELGELLAKWEALGVEVAG